MHWFKNISEYDRLVSSWPQGILIWSLLIRHHILLCCWFSDSQFLSCLINTNDFFALNYCNRSFLFAAWIFYFLFWFISNLKKNEILLLPRRRRRCLRAWVGSKTESVFVVDSKNTLQAIMISKINLWAVENLNNWGWP